MLFRSREVVFAATKWLNYFPAAGGVSDTLSPYTIMTGKPSLDYNLLRLEFGSYVQIFEENDPTNTTKSRNTGAIALSHTGNLQGDYFFMSLDTGKRLSRHAWTVIPMPNIVIDTVERMAMQERQPQINGNDLLFELAHNMPMVDDDLVNEALDVYDEAYFVLNGFDDAQPDPIDNEDDVPLLDIKALEIEDPGNAAAFVPLVDDVILDDEVVVPNRILNHDDINGLVNAIDNDDLDSIAELDIIPEPDINIPDEPTH